MVISVYHFTARKLSLLSTAQVSYDDEGKDQRVAMASGSSEEVVYIFSSDGMWSIQTKTVLTNVVRLQSGLNGFNSRIVGVDKLYHGVFNSLFGIKRHEAVFVIAESES